MKNKIVLVAVIIVSFGYSQSKWDSSFELDFVFQNSKDYFYNDSNKRIIDT